MGFGSYVIRAVLGFMTLAMVCVSMAQNNQQDFLNAHNTPRAQVGAGAMTWNTTVAAYAQNYANKMASTCNLVHSNGPYGENLAWSSSSTFTGTAAAGKVCGHYTQVVWKKSIRLGCARVVCNAGGTFVICSYDPPGNYVGQKPY